MPLRAPQYYQQFFPPITNRIIFDCERTPSPPPSSCTTNRQLFGVDVIRDSSYNIDSEEVPTGHGSGKEFWMSALQSNSDLYSEDHKEAQSDINTDLPVDEETSRHGSLFLAWSQCSLKTSNRIDGSRHSGSRNIDTNRTQAASRPSLQTQQRWLFFEDHVKLERFPV